MGMVLADIVSPSEDIRTAACGFSGIGCAPSFSEFLSLDRVSVIESELDGLSFDIGWRRARLVAEVTRLLCYRSEVPSLASLDYDALDRARRYLWDAWLLSAREVTSCRAASYGIGKYNAGYGEIIGRMRLLGYDRRVALEWADGSSDSWRRAPSRAAIKHYGDKAAEMAPGTWAASSLDILKAEARYWDAVVETLAGGVLVDVIVTYESGVPLEYMAAGVELGL